MFSYRRSALGIGALALLSLPAFAAPPLTTIQDVLFKADGTRFNGIVTITSPSFQADDGSNIGAQSHSTIVVNGILNVQLVPTTDAAAAVTYTVVYNSAGNTQWTESWAVPPSAIALRVAQVRVSDGLIVTPAPVSTSIQISDVGGLQNELNVRPQIGIAYTPSRVAIIDAAGLIDGAQGNSFDCVHTDGSTGPCGSGATSPGFVEAETPGGTVDGSNTTFTLATAPNPSASLSMYRNGLLMKQAVDYTLASSTITLTIAPQPGDTLVAWYRIAVVPGFTFVDNETPTGNVDGFNATFTLAQTPAPAASLKLYLNGLVMKPGTDYTLAGNVVTFVNAQTPLPGDVLDSFYRISQ